MICDHDRGGRQRLRFVRTISGETEQPLLRDGGAYINTHESAYYDGRHDAWEAREGLLGAPGGLMEVFWGMDTRPNSTTVWRGVRTPIGGRGSIFHNSNIETRGPVAKSSKKDAEADSERSVPFSRIARPLTDGVIFLRFSFWGPTTNTWDPLALPARKTTSRPSGPLFHWDSTRAVLDYSGGDDELTFEPREGSLLDTSDDVFPERVEVTIVLQDDGDQGALVLSEKIGANTLSFLLSRAVSLPDDPRDRFLLIGDEWVEVDSTDGRHIKLVRQGRGGRETVPRAHERGTIVRTGVTFRRVIEIPGSGGRFETKSGGLR